MTLSFTKMQGAGNDFVVLDLRDGQPLPDRTTLQRLADRHYGVGCDQIMVLQPARTAGSLASYLVVNGDGSFAQQCGNGVRCLSAWLHRAGDLPDTAVLDGPTAPVHARRREDGSFEVGLSAPAFTATDIPVVAESDSCGGYRLDVDGRSIAFGAVSMGNPHVIIEVDDVARAPVAIARSLQTDATAFPDGCNVGFVQLLARDHLALRVVERGVGETLACGSGACAAHAWLRRAGRVDAQTRIDLPGGTLTVAWSGTDQPVWLGGPATFVFEGNWSS